MNTLKLLELTAKNYASLRNETINFGDLNVFIGANGSGKSTILDALLFLQVGLKSKDFRQAVGRRGGPRYLFGKWDKKQRAELSLIFEDTEKNSKFRWAIVFTTLDREFFVKEEVFELNRDGLDIPLLSVESGSGWWMSGNEHKVQIQQESTICALAVASVDAAFNARVLDSFVADWKFVDPILVAIREGWGVEGSERLHFDGSNLLERLYRLRETFPEQFDLIISATRSVLGMPETIEPDLHSHDDSHNEYFLHFYESGLNSPFNQRSASDGTLRILTLMTSLFEDSGRGLVAMEEPENNIHPSALGDFVGYLVDASRRTQLMITTHSPNLVNYLHDPETVRVVRRDETHGTNVSREKNPEGVRRALAASGFALGEFHETNGFGR